MGVWGVSKNENTPKGPTGLSDPNRPVLVTRKVNLWPPFFESEDAAKKHAEKLTLETGDEHFVEPLTGGLG